MRMLYTGPLLLQQVYVVNVQKSALMEYTIHAACVYRFQLISEK